MDPVLLIYTPEITPRVKYCFALFFESIISTSYRITADKAEYDTYQGPKLNYSSGAAGNEEFAIRSAGLLSQSGLSKQEIAVSEWNGLKIFFRTGGGDLPFDIFSATFFLVSRYEEYIVHTRDEHVRFKAVSSLAYQNHFLEQPLVNLWAMELKKALMMKYPQLIFRENSYAFLPTLDIDIAYAHSGRNIAVTIGSYLRLLSKFQRVKLSEKTAVLFGLKHDPYDTYAWQEEVFRKYNLAPVYFFLASERRTRYDRNIDTHGKSFAELVKKINAFAQVGIHPSYYSASQPETVMREVSNVERYLPYKITKSRQHFLKMSLPETYRCLAGLNITDDYSLAYAGAPGFRASICTPFPFYDLKAEQTLQVVVHSPAVMDGTLNEYMHISPREAETVIERLVAQVKYCKGEFISIWHNHSLSEQGHWKGWRKVFENMIKTALI